MYASLYCGEGTRIIAWKNSKRDHWLRRGLFRPVFGTNFFLIRRVVVYEVR